MDATTIDPEDAKRIVEALQPSLDYLRRLRERMVAAGFLPDDPLLESVGKSYDAMSELYMTMHYVSCPNGGAGSGTAPKS